MPYGGTDNVRIVKVKLHGRKVVTENSEANNPPPTAAFDPMFPRSRPSSQPATPDEGRSPRGEEDFTEYDLTVLGAPFEHCCWIDWQAQRAQQLEQLREDISGVMNVQQCVLDDISRIITAASADDTTLKLRTGDLVLFQAFNDDPERWFILGNRDPDFGIFNDNEHVRWNLIGSSES